MQTADRYYGTWDLIPELSLYEFGPVPASGTYTIEPAEVGVRIRMSWTLTPDGPESHTEFAGTTDGSTQILDSGKAAGSPVTFSLTRLDSRTLESRAFRGEEEFAFARRVVSHEGDLLAIVQEGRHRDGTRFRNFQVYRRRNDTSAG